MNERLIRMGFPEGTLAYESVWFVCIGCAMGEGFHAGAPSEGLRRCYLLCFLRPIMVSTAAEESASRNHSVRGALSPV